MQLLGLAAIHQFIHIGDHADGFWWFVGKMFLAPKQQRTFILCWN
jgi:acyl-[acyl carrier protein]--UDP-N-acetylglucosamine O-acyltransferase